MSKLIANDKAIVSLKTIFIEDLICPTFLPRIARMRYGQVEFNLFYYRTLEANLLIVKQGHHTVKFSINRRLTREEIADELACHLYHWYHYIRPCEEPHPPCLFEKLAYLALNHKDRERIMGDLMADYKEACEKFGERAANRIYAWGVIREIIDAYREKVFKSVESLLNIIKIVK